MKKRKFVIDGLKAELLAANKAKAAAPTPETELVVETLTKKIAEREGQFAQAKVHGALWTRHEPKQPTRPARSQAEQESGRRLSLESS